MNRGYADLIYKSLVIIHACFSYILYCLSHLMYVQVVNLYHDPAGEKILYGTMSTLTKLPNPTEHLTVVTDAAKPHVN